MDDLLTPGQAESVKTDFWARFERYMELMKKSRSIEIAIRIATELDETNSHFIDKDFEAFKKSGYAHETQKYQKLLKEFLPQHEAQLRKVQMVADAVAHLDLARARNKLIAYGKDYELANEITDEPVGITRLNNVRCEDGEVRDLGYLITSSERNLLTEEMKVFESQGAFAAADALFDEIRTLIETEAKDIELIDIGVTVQRALKFGKPIS
jgi:hypothetical protein